MYFGEPSALHTSEKRRYMLVLVGPSCRPAVQGDDQNSRASLGLEFVHEARPHSSVEMRGLAV